MKLISKLAFIIISVLTFSSCEETKRAFGKIKEAPDEFAVYRRAPLSLPPDFDLRPPAPGTQRPQMVNPRNRVYQALGMSKGNPDRDQSNKSLNSANLSSGEQALLVLTGANQANPQIRQLVEERSNNLFESDKAFTDKILFWQSKEKFGVTIDPEKELKRIREAQALGKPLSKEDIPIISRKKKALLEGIFD